MTSLLVGLTLAFLCCGGDASPLARQKRESDGCDDGWIQFESNCYLVVLDRQDFATAQQTCQEDEASLLDVRSANEFEAIQEYVDNAFSVLSNIDAVFWLGAKKNGDNYKWLDDSDITFDNFAAGEPNSTVGDCLIAGGSRKWKAQDCSKVKRFVCKKPAEEAELPVEAVLTTAAPVTTAPATTGGTGSGFPSTTAAAGTGSGFPSTTGAVTAPFTTSAPAPFTTSAPAPFTTSAPAPFTTSAPAPFTTSAPAPAPATFTTSGAAPQPAVFTTSAPAPFTTAAPPPVTTAESPFKRTVIFLRRETQPGEDVFLRGGISHDRREGCTEEAATSPCAIPIQSRDPQMADDHVAFYELLRQGDEYLDWYGREEDQFDTAEGTPAIWTTNDASNAFAYNPLNTFGPHYWMVDIDMDCSKTIDGFFELKGFVNGVWENDVPNQCGGAPFASNNHIAECGKINVFSWNNAGCEITDL